MMLLLLVVVSRWWWVTVARHILEVTKGILMGWRHLVLLLPVAVVLTGSRLLLLLLSPGQVALEVRVQGPPVPPRVASLKAIGGLDGGRRHQGLGCQLLLGLLQQPLNL